MSEGCSCVCFDDDNDESTDADVSLPFIVLSMSSVIWTLSGGMLSDAPPSDVAVSDRRRSDDPATDNKPTDVSWEPSRSAPPGGGFALRNQLDRFFRRIICLRRTWSKRLRLVDRYCMRVVDNSGLMVRPWRTDH